MRILVALLILFTCSTGYCAVNFADSANDKIAISDSTSLDSPNTSVSVSAWFYSVVSSGVTQIILSKRSAWSATGIPYELAIGDSEDVRWSAFRVIGNSVDVSPDGEWVLNNWYHMTGTWDGTDVIVYINGANVGSGEHIGTITDNNTDVAIGRLPASSAEGFGGKLSDVAVWNVCLTPAEVWLLYTSKIKGMPLQIQPDNLIAYYPLDDYPHNNTADSANGLTFKDRSGNGNDGTASGGNSQAEEILSYM